MELKLLLRHCITQKYFTLEEYNKSLVYFNYGYTESDRPVPIIQRHFQSDKPIKSSASQMLLLLRILPFLIGSVVPDSDRHWKCFLLLRKIIDMVFCPVVTTGMADSLKILIIEHHETFVSLYPSCFIPKMHFLIHYPEQMLLVGPMVRTTRHEVKLNFFKQTTGISSFKNITLSLANYHQRLACYELWNAITELHTCHFMLHIFRLIQGLWQYLWMVTLVCHKKAAGASAHGPLSGESMFLNQSQVDTFVANYTCTTAAKVSIIPPISLGITSLFLFLPCVQECSDFLAGSALRSKTRYTWRDSCDGCCCRHK